MNLVEFLRARLDEDERVARDCGVQLSDGKLHLRDGDTITIDARRVLAEVDAKRRIIDDYELMTSATYAGTETASADVIEPFIRLLALPYASHPDYRDEWKP